MLAHGLIAPAAFEGLALLTTPWCTACGMPFPEERDAAPLCTLCAGGSRTPGRLISQRGLDRVRSALGYNEAIAPAILRLKYSDRQNGVAAFAALMRQAGRELLGVADVVLVPVPLHPRRLRQRGYNQAGLLANAIARPEGLSVAPLALRRVRATPGQKGASAAQRLRNVAGAFAVADTAALVGRHVILIDDVLTSGATLQACARAVRRAKPASVSALTLARVVKTPETPYSSNQMLPT